MWHLRKDRDEIVLAEIVPGAKIEREGADGETGQGAEEGFKGPLRGWVGGRWDG